MLRSPAATSGRKNWLGCVSGPTDTAVSVLGVSPGMASRRRRSSCESSLRGDRPPTTRTAVVSARRAPGGTVASTDRSELSELCSTTNGTAAALVVAASRAATSSSPQPPGGAERSTARLHKGEAPSIRAHPLGRQDRQSRTGRGAPASGYGSGDGDEAAEVAADVVDGHVLGDRGTPPASSVPRPRSPRPRARARIVSRSSTVSASTAAAKDFAAGMPEPRDEPDVVGREPDDRQEVHGSATVRISILTRPRPVPGPAGRAPRRAPTAGGARRPRAPWSRGRRRTRRR